MIRGNPLAARLPTEEVEVLGGKLREERQLSVIGGTRMGTWVVVALWRKNAPA